MKDIPLFSTQFGTASLALKEVPYRREAYVHVIDSLPGGLDGLLGECRSFCRMVGAERVYVKDCPGLEGYPIHTAVMEMRGSFPVDGQLLPNLFPVTEQTAKRWRQIYNDKMASVDNAGTLEARDEGELLSKGAYFVHDRGELLGIFWLKEDKLLALAAVKPGAGRLIMQGVMSLAEGEQLTLEVASTNERAIRLYESLGFLRTRELSRWYCLE